jgi:hypothetical protein
MSAQIKKAHLILVFFLLLLPVFFVFFKPGKIEAQDEPTPTPEQASFEKAYNDYQTQISEYNNAHSEYVLRRSQYLRFRSLQSQQEAFDATSKMLQERDDVNISYLEVLKERLNEAVGVSEQTKNDLNVRLNDEIGWFTDHKSRIHTAGTLEDLIGDSDLSKNRYSFEVPLFYEVLSTIPDGKITDFDERLKDNFVSLKRKIDEIKAEGRDDYKFSDSKLQQLDRWVFEADNRIQRAEQKQVDAQNESSKYKTQANRAAYVYDTVTLRLGEAQQFLKESGSYITEIIRSIKTQEE